MSDELQKSNDATDTSTINHTPAANDFEEPVVHAQEVEAEAEQAAEAAVAEAKEEPADEKSAHDAHASIKDIDKPGSGLDWPVIVVCLLLAAVGIYFMCAHMFDTPADPTAIDPTENQIIQPTEQKSLPIAELSEGVAAVVNGEEIPEQTITDYIVDFRNSSGMTDDVTWGKWIVGGGYTLDTLREAAISMFVSRALMEQAAAEMNIVAEEAKIEELYKKNRDMFPTQEEWESALAMSGYTEESFREQLAFSAIQEAIMDVVAADAISKETIDADTLNYLKSSYEEYKDAQSLADIPADIVSNMREMVEYYAKQDALSAFMTTKRENAKIEMSKTPNDLPYSVFLLPYYFTNAFDQAMAESKAKTSSNSKSTSTTQSTSSK